MIRTAFDRYIQIFPRIKSRIYFLLSYIKYTVIAHSPRRRPQRARKGFCVTSVKGGVALGITEDVVHPRSVVVRGHVCNNVNFINAYNTNLDPAAPDVCCTLFKMGSLTEQFKNKPQTIFSEKLLIHTTNIIIPVLSRFYYFYPTMSSLSGANWCTGTGPQLQYARRRCGRGFQCWDVFHAD